MNRFRIQGLQWIILGTLSLGAFGLPGLGMLVLQRFRKGACPGAVS